MKRKILLLISILTFLFTISSCTSQRKNPPYFVDRTAGWKASLICDTLFAAMYYPPDHDIYHSYIFDGSNITDDTNIFFNSELSNKRIMEDALQTAFGLRYCGIGQGEITIYDIDQSGIRVYATNQAAVFLNRNNNQLVQCVDLRLQSQFKKERNLDFYKGEIGLCVEIANLSKDKIVFFTENVSTWAGGGTLQYDENDLPLTAQRAYEVTADDLYTKYANKPGGMGDIGGAFKVYDCAKSNSWLIVGNVFAQMLDKTNGERIFLEISCVDKSKRECRRDGSVDTLLTHATTAPCVQASSSTTTRDGAWQAESAALRCRTAR